MAHSQKSRRQAAGIAAVAVMLGLAALTESSAAPRIRTGNRGDEAAPEEAAEPKTDPKIAGKLDQVLDNQQKIMSQLDALMEEIKIVKIRATR